MKYLQATFLLLFSFIGQAQNTFFKTIELFETSDQGWTVIAEDDGYIISSGSTCYSPGSFYSCTYIIKTDLAGEIIWTNLLDGGPESTGGLGSLQKVEEENYIVNGGIRPVLYSEKFQGRVLKLDAQGDTLWSTVYGDTLNSFMAWMAHELESGNTLTLGWNGQLNDEEYEYHLAKYTPEGELLFIKPIELECYTRTPSQIVPTSDGNLLVSLECWGADNDNRVPAIAKVDTSGNVLWKKEWPEWDIECFTWANPTVVAMEDGGYVLPWCFDRPDIHPYHTSTILMRFKADHEMLWELPLFGDNSYVNDTILYINSIYITFTKKAANGDFLLVGYDHNSSLEGIGGQGYLSRVSPEGELLWRRLYVFPDDPSGSSGVLYNLDEKEDGRIALTDDVRQTLPDSNGARSNVVLMVVDEDGCLNSGCTDEYIFVSNITPTGEAVQTYEEVYFRLSPNPVSNQGTINFHMYNPTNIPDYQISLYAIDGRLVHDQKLDLGVQNIDIPIGNFTSGLYLAVLKQEGRIVQQERFVVE